MQTIGGVVTQAAGIARRVSDELYYARVCASAGLMVIDPPRTGLAIARAVRRYGQLGAATAIAGARNGDRTAIVDERGSLTFGELDERVNRAGERADRSAACAAATGSRCSCATTPG